MPNPSSISYKTPEEAGDTVPAPELAPWMFVEMNGKEASAASGIPVGRMYMLMKAIPDDGPEYIDAWPVGDGDELRTNWHAIIQYQRRMSERRIDATRAALSMARSATRRGTRKSAEERRKEEERATQESARREQEERSRAHYDRNNW